MTLLISTKQCKGDLLIVATGTSDTIQDNTTEVINLNNTGDICNELGEISPRSNSVGGLVQDLPLICGGLGLNGRR